MASDPIISELPAVTGDITPTDLLVVQRGAADLTHAPVSKLGAVMKAASLEVCPPLGHQHARADLPWISDPGAALMAAETVDAQRTALGMTRWAMAPWTDGTTNDVPEGSRLYYTDARADARIAAQKGQAEGIMPLDSGGKAPLAYMPDALLGQVKFQGVWNAATNMPTLAAAVGVKGHYYVVSVAGSYGGIDYGVGDWCISDGTAWGKVDNSDAITSFAGRVGAILPIASDYASFYLGLSATASDSSKLGGQLPSYYSQASHVHTFAGLTSKPTTLAGYGITDALSVSGTAYDSQRLGGKLAADFQEKLKQVNVSITSPICAIFESSNADAQFRLVNMSSGGHTFSFGSGGYAAGAGAGFYIYDESAGRLRMKIDASTGQPVFSFFSSGALTSDAYGGLSSIAGFTGTKTIGGVTLTFEHGLLVS